VALLLERREYDKLAQPQSHLVGITPERVDRGVADKVVGLDIAVWSFSSFKQGYELPCVFVFLHVSAGYTSTYVNIASSLNEEQDEQLHPPVVLSEPWCLPVALHVSHVNA